MASIYALIFFTRFYQILQARDIYTADDKSVMQPSSQSAPYEWYCSSVLMAISGTTSALQPTAMKFSSNKFRRVRIGSPYFIGSNDNEI